MMTVTPWDISEFSWASLKYLQKYGLGPSFQLFIPQVIRGVGIDVVFM